MIVPFKVHCSNRIVQEWRRLGGERHPKHVENAWLAPTLLWESFVHCHVEVLALFVVLVALCGDGVFQHSISGDILARLRT